MARGFEIAIPLFFALILIVTAVPAAACEPLPPALLILGGSPMTWGGYAAGLLHSIYIFFAIISIKCFLFAYKERHTDGIWRAFIVMFIANMFSTLPGIGISILIVSPMLFVISPFIFYVVNIFPSGILAPQVSRWRFVRKPFALNLLMICITYIAIFFFFMSQGTLGSGSTGGIYWLQKIAFTYSAVCVSLILTIGYEGTIAIEAYKRTSRKPRAILSSVAWANVWTMFIATGIAAAAMLPRRFESRDFLVRLFDQIRSLFA